MSERYENLKAMAEARAAGMPDYPDSKEDAAEIDETVRAAMPLQITAIRALEGESDSDLIKRHVMQQNLDGWA